MESAERMKKGTWWKSQLVNNTHSTDMAYANGLVASLYAMTTLHFSSNGPIPVFCLLREKENFEKEMVLGRSTRWICVCKLQCWGKVDYRKDTRRKLFSFVSCFMGD